MSTLKKCEHEWIQKTGLGYHCRKCRTAQIRPSPSPEARVDWEKEALIKISGHGCSRCWSDDYQEKCTCEKERGAMRQMLPFIQAAYETGVKKGEGR